jgi:hypothetical protein
MAAQRGGASYMHGAPLDMTGAPMSVHHMDGMPEGVQSGMSAEMHSHHQMMLGQGMGHEMISQDMGPPPQSVATSSGMSYTEMDENIAHSHSQPMQRIGESIPSHSQQTDQ